MGKYIVAVFACGMLPLVLGMCMATLESAGIWNPQASGFEHSFIRGAIFVSVLVGCRFVWRLVTHNWHNLFWIVPQTVGIVCRLIGHLDIAISKLSLAIQRHPDNPVAYYERGRAYLAKREFEKAIFDFTETLRLGQSKDHDYSYCYCRRGEAHLLCGNVDDAISDLTESLRLNPKTFRSYSLRGEAYASKGEYERAIDDYTSALRLKPNRPLTLWRRGEAYQRLGQAAKAEQDFAKAKEMGH